MLYLFGVYRPGWEARLNASTWVLYLKRKRKKTESKDIPCLYLTCCLCQVIMLPTSHHIAITAAVPANAICASNYRGLQSTPLEGPALGTPPKKAVSVMRLSISLRPIPGPVKENFFLCVCLLYFSSGSRLLMWGHSFFSLGGVGVQLQGFSCGSAGGGGWSNNLEAT